MANSSGAKIQQSGDVGPDFLKKNPLVAAPPWAFTHTDAGTVDIFQCACPRTRNNTVAGNARAGSQREGLWHGSGVTVDVAVVDDTRQCRNIASTALADLRRRMCSSRSCFFVPPPPGAWVIRQVALWDFSVNAITFAKWNWNRVISNHQAVPGQRPNHRGRATQTSVRPAGRPNLGARLFFGNTRMRKHFRCIC